VSEQGCGDAGGSGEPQDGDGEVTRRLAMTRGRWRADLEAVFVEVHVADPVQAVLDGPLAADDGGEFGGLTWDQGSAKSS
jgi:hypothetical protein